MCVLWRDYLNLKKVLENFSFIVKKRIQFIVGNKYRHACALSRLSQSVRKYSIGKLKLFQNCILVLSVKRECSVHSYILHCGKLRVQVKSFYNHFYSFCNVCLYRFGDYKSSFLFLNCDVVGEGWNTQEQSLLSEQYSICCVISVSHLVLVALRDFWAEV